MINLTTGGLLSQFIIKSDFNKEVKRQIYSYICFKYSMSFNQKLTLIRMLLRNGNILMCYEDQ